MTNYLSNALKYSPADKLVQIALARGTIYKYLATDSFPELSPRSDMAEMALWTRGFENVGPRIVKIVSENLLDLYRTFVNIVTLTRSLVDR